MNVDYDCEMRAAMERVEFETKTNAWLTVMVRGRSPREVMLSDVDAWLRAAAEKGIDTGWVPKVDINKLGLSEPVADALRSIAGELSEERDGWKRRALKHGAELEAAYKVILEAHNALPNTITTDSTLPAKCEAASRRIADQARNITTLESTNKQVGETLTKMVAALQNVPGETVLDKCVEAGSLWAKLETERYKRNELHRRTQQAEAAEAKALRVLQVAEEKLKRNIARSDGLEASMGPDWVRRLVDQRDNWRTSYGALAKRFEVAELVNRNAIADVSKRLCELVTVAHGNNNKRSTHFLGLLGVEFGQEGEAGQQATQVRNEIHKVVFERAPDPDRPRPPTRGEIESKAVAGAIRYLLGKFGIEYVDTGDPIEFAHFTLSRCQEVRL